MFLSSSLEVRHTNCSWKHSFSFTTSITCHVFVLCSPSLFVPFRLKLCCSDKSEHFSVHMPKEEAQLTAGPSEFWQEENEEVEVDQSVGLTFHCGQSQVCLTVKGSERLNRRASPVYQLGTLVKPLMKKLGWHELSVFKYTFKVLIIGNILLCKAATSMLFIWLLLCYETTGWTAHFLKTISAHWPAIFCSEPV